MSDEIRGFQHENSGITRDDVDSGIIKEVVHGKANPDFAGWIKDALGNGVEGVSVFNDGVRVALTSGPPDTGAFQVNGVEVGTICNLTAIKDGWIFLPAAYSLEIVDIREEPITTIITFNGSATLR